jgi:hypothetical protein
MIDTEMEAHGARRVYQRGGLREGQSAPSRAEAQSLEKRAANPGGGVDAVRGAHPCHDGRLETVARSLITISLASLEAKPDQEVVGVAEAIDPPRDPSKEVTKSKTGSKPSTCSP